MCIVIPPSTLLLLLSIFGQNDEREHEGGGNSSVGLPLCLRFYGGGRAANEDKKQPADFFPVPFMDRGTCRELAATTS